MISQRLPIRQITSTTSSRRARRASHLRAKVTGTGDNQTTLQDFKRHHIKLSDLNALLTLFSPHSKHKESSYPEVQGEIDVLIATDCISEGQNLQDCDYLVNYDIHWNPVRIIQRFGRIDRIGSRSATVQLVNFWPTKDLDEYIDLVERVRGRMVLLDVSATGEENIIDEKAQKGMNDLAYRKKQMEQLKHQSSTSKTSPAASRLPT